MSIGHIVGPDRFGVLLGLVLAMFVSVPLVQERRAGFVVMAALASLLVIATLSACGVTGRWKRFSILAVVGSGLIASGGSAFTDGSSPAWVSALYAVMLAAAPVLVLRRILDHDRVTLSTVAGALCTFMLVGLAFAALYRTIDVLDADAFTVELGNASGYFSFVTLSTLGYGDIAPVSDIARSLTVLEAVLGQVLMVTLVARFVGTLGQTKPRRDKRDLAASRR